MSLLHFEQTLWRAGECIACWTSEQPGRTGPRKPWWRWLAVLTPTMRRRGWRLRLRVRQ